MLNSKPQKSQRVNLKHQSIWVAKLQEKSRENKRQDRSVVYQLKKDGVIGKFYHTNDDTDVVYRTLEKK